MTFWGGNENYIVVKVLFERGGRVTALRNHVTQKRASGPHVLPKIRPCHLFRSLDPLCFCPYHPAMTKIQCKIVITCLMVVIGVLLAVSFYSFMVKTLADKADFRALYRTSVHALETRTLTPESLGYYPPSGRPILMFFALLPESVAPVIWWLTGVGLHGISFYIFVRYLVPFRSSDPLLLAMLLAFSLLPWLAGDLSGGNISPMMLASVVVGYFLYRRGWLWSSAMVVGAGVALKFLPVFLVIFYGVKRKWGIFWRSILAAIVIGILPGMMIFGVEHFWGSWKTWSESALSKRTARYIIVDSPHGISYVNQSLPNVLLHILSPVSAGHDAKPFFVNIVKFSRPSVYKIWMIFILISGSAWLYVIWPRKFDGANQELVQFGFVCLPMVWFCPHILSYYLTILMPAVGILLWAVLERPQAIRPAVRRLRIFVLLYALGCLLLASEYARAYGNYLGIIFILAIALVLISRQLRFFEQSSFQRLNMGLAEDTPAEPCAGNHGEHA